MEIFGRATLAEIAELLESFGHAGLTRFLLSNEMEDVAQHGNLRDRGNAVFRYLLLHVDHTSSDKQSLRTRIVLAAIDAALKPVQDSEDFWVSHPGLLQALTNDGCTLVQGELVLPFLKANRSEAVFENDHTEIPNMPNVRLFISHSSKDTEYVKRLITLLRSALELPAKQIRCTSVDGYGLQAGASAAETLRAEIHDSEAFIGIISSNSLQSLYVMFELGARWGAKKHLIPLLGPGADYNILAAPLTDLHALRGTDRAHLLQLVSDLSAALHVQSSAPQVYHADIEALAALSVIQETASPPPHPESQVRPLPVLSPEAHQIMSKAAQSDDPSIMRVSTMSGVHVSVDDVEFTEGKSRRQIARWDAAISDLEGIGYIKDVGHKGEVFELTREGWEVADLLGPNP